MARACTHRLSKIAAALIVAFGSGALHAAPPSQDALVAELKRMAERLDRIEKRNAELEAQIKARPAAANVEERVKALESRNAQIDDALNRDTISEQEPELTARLKGAEYTSLDIQKQAKIIEGLDGFSAGASLTGVAQRMSGVDSPGSVLNYRADITVTTPTVAYGNIDSKLFGHFRVGQGKGVSERLTSFVGPNASSFQLGSVIPPESSAVMLAQAWYQADIPLPLGGVKSLSREKLTVNIGKMDPFAFFDQNKGANDETRQFLASSFVHNALLDNPLAANVGADGFGFSPGVRLAYSADLRKPSRSYGASLGIFGAGRSANFSEPFKSPFVIAQAETKQLLFSGLEGNYRAFIWRNGQAPTFVPEETRPHTGFGLNFDQRVDDAVTLFGRYGSARGDRLPFDRTASLGGEIGGSYWKRAADAVGIAFGANRASADFRAQSAGLLDGNGNPVFGFASAGWEKTAEIYYRFLVHPKFEITPDFQYIRNPAANPGAKPVKIVGARLQLTY